MSSNFQGDVRYFDWNFAVSMKTGIINEAILAYKYSPKVSAWGIIFGRILTGFLNSELGSFVEFDLVIPSPTYVGQDRQARSWDHTSYVVEMAAEYDEDGQWPLLHDNPVIRKTSLTPRLTSLSKWNDRYRVSTTDLRNALVVPNSARTRGKNILVFDDIFTDGLNLNEVARCLHVQGNADLVCGVSLARAPWR